MVSENYGGTIVAVLVSDAAAIQSLQIHRNITGVPIIPVKFTAHRETGLAAISKGPTGLPDIARGLRHAQGRSEASSKFVAQAAP